MIFKDTNFVLFEIFQHRWPPFLRIERDRGREKKDGEYIVKACGEVRWGRTVLGVTKKGE